MSKNDEMWRFLQEILAELYLKTWKTFEPVEDTYNKAWNDYNKL